MRSGGKFCVLDFAKIRFILAHKATVTKPSKGAGEIDKLALSISYFDPYYGTTHAFTQSRKPSTSKLYWHPLALSPAHRNFIPVFLIWRKTF